MSDENHTGSATPDSGGVLSLEARLDRIEAIATRLDRPDLELEEALALFEEGVGHLRAAREVVRHAEMRIERLLDDGEGGTTVAPVDGG